MATADELLALTAEEIDVLTIDLDTRVIAIPASVTILGVESDDDVKRLHFKIPRYYGEFDLSEFGFQINFKHAKSSSGDFYPADEVTATNDDHISFSWLVDRSAFNRAGDVEFSICMKKYDENGVVIKELNTAVAMLPVLKGLETTKAVVESNPSAFDALLFRLYAVEAATGAGQNGYYTIAKVNETETGIEVTIIDKEGTTVATVRHGIDGYTPVKGVDYWTNEELGIFKTDVTQTLKNYIDNWSPDYKTITLTAANWNENVQTVAIEEVDVNSVIFVSPEPSLENYTMYNDHGIRCVAQGNGFITFTCESPPEVDVLVNVAVYFRLDTINNAGDFIITDDGNGNVSIL